MRQSDRVVDEDKEAFERFFQRVRPTLTGYAFLMTGSLPEAHELAQETLARAWARWDRVQRYEHQDAWARKVVRHLVVAKWRHSRVQRDVPLPAPTTATSGAEDEIVAHLDVLTALRSIPPKQRHAIVLHDFVGLTVAEVGVEMGVPQGTVKSWISRGRAALADRLRSSDLQQAGGA